MKSIETPYLHSSPLALARPQSIIAPPSAIGKVVQAVTVTDGKTEVATISGLVIMGMFMVDVTN